MNIEQSKSIKIHEYLAGIGIDPVSIRGDNYWYTAPYRQDNNPSLSVNIKENLWYDMAGYGGDLVKLVEMIHCCNVSEALNHIQNVTPVQVNISSFERKNDSQIEIRKKVPGLNNPALINYIQSRGLDPRLAGLYLWEIYYQISGKNFFAVGFENDSEGYEIRNKYFKGSMATKDITVLCNNSTDCCVFEGWPDFLSYKQYVELRTSDYIIMNSVAMVNRTIEPLKKYENIFYWGQNDEPGQSVLNTLYAAGLTLVDCRWKFKGYKDLNEKYTQKK